MMRVRSNDDTVTIRLDQSVREKIIHEHEYERSQHDITRRPGAPPTRPRAVYSRAAPPH
jgi:hypothetical protein